MAQRGGGRMYAHRDVRRTGVAVHRCHTRTAKPVRHRERNGWSPMSIRIPHLSEDVDTLTAALKYAEAGWFVLPVKPETKNAGSVLGKGWHTKSSRDPKQIAAWFAATDYQIALHVGRSGAIAFD